jgi:DNA-binding CsgD family transcriptional regulator
VCIQRADRIGRIACARRLCNVSDESSAPGPSTPADRSGGTGGPSSSERLRRLTPRQKDCLRLARPGYPSKSIARDLDISSLRVDGHIGDAKRVLGVASRFEAARLLRSWEAGEGAPSLGVQMGVQSAPLSHANDLRSDGNAVDTKDMPEPPSTRTPAAAGSSSGQTGRDDGTAPSHRFVRSASDVRVAPSFFAVAVSILAVAIAVGAVTALLIAFDWIGRV